MLGINLDKALSLCNLKETDIDNSVKKFNNNLLLFHFDGSKKALANYLYLLFETSNILILNPTNRSQFSKSFHSGLPYEFVVGLDNFPPGNKKYLDQGKTILTDRLIRLIIPTSGTTASPKLVCFSENKLYKAAKNISLSLSISKEDIACGYLPTNYGYGLSVLHSHLFSNSKFFLPEVNTKFIDLLMSSNCTNFYTVPSMLKYIDKFAEKILLKSNAKKLCQAGGALSQSQVDFWNSVCIKNNIEFIRMYGQTECGPRISCLRGKDYLNYPTSVGSAIPSVDIEISNSDGEILINSSMLSDGYFSNNSESWNIEELPTPFPTGDLGEIDNDGFLTILGRSSRFVKIQDIRLSLDEIEFVSQEITKVDIAAFQDQEHLAIVPSQNTKEDLVGFLSKNFGIPKRNIKLFSEKYFILNGNNKKDYPSMKSKISS